jgi:hypothetical protein
MATEKDDRRGICDGCGEEKEVFPADGAPACGISLCAECSASSKAYLDSVLGPFDIDDFDETGVELPDALESPQPLIDKLRRS